MFLLIKNAFFIVMFFVISILLAQIFGFWILFPLGMACEIALKEA